LLLLYVGLAPHKQNFWLRPLPLQKQILGDSGYGKAD